MKHQEAQSLFIDYLENTLKSQDKDRLSAHLTDCAVCAKAWDNYKHIVSQLEQIKAENENLSVPLSLHKNIIAKISTNRENKFSNLIANIFRPKFILPSTALVCGVFALMMSTRNIEDAEKIKIDLLQSTAPSTMTVETLTDKAVVSANQPPQNAGSIDEQPVAMPSAIPPGFRAVTIGVDRRSGVEGFAAGPSKRVDVLWTYQDRSGSRKLATIVRSAQILSVGGATGENGNGSLEANQSNAIVTLLASDLDAKKIELARQSGNLSLALAGDTDPGRLTPQSEAIEMRDLLPKTSVTSSNKPMQDGVMYALDPTSGKTIKWILLNGRWRRAQDSESESKNDQANTAQITIIIEAKLLDELSTLPKGSINLFGIDLIDGKETLLVKNISYEILSREATGDSYQVIVYFPRSQLEHIRQAQKTMHLTLKADNTSKNNAS